jgi:proteasome alpha subunit
VLNVVKDRHAIGMSLGEGLRMAIDALSSSGGEGGQARELPRAQLEVAILDRRKSGRTFRRIVGAALDALLNNGAAADKADQADSPPGVAVPPAPAKKDDPAPPPAESGPETRAQTSENPGTAEPTTDA